MAFRKFVLLFAGFNLVAAIAGAATYTYATISVPGATSTPVASGINDSGQIVGYYTSSMFLGYLNNGANFTTISVPGSFGTQPLGANNRGQVVGTFLTSTGGRNAFVYANGSASTLNVLGAGFAEATDINNSGQIVGYYSTGAGFMGFVGTSGTFTSLHYPGSTATEAFGINDPGRIVGIYVDSIGAGHSYLYSNGNFAPISVPGDPNATATGINNQGQIVGYFSTGSGYSAFLDDNGVFTTLSVPGSFGTEAFGINEAGQIVGFYFDSVGRQFAFVASPVPEPASVMLVSAAAMAFFLLSSRRWI